MRCHDIWGIIASLGSIKHLEGIDPFLGWNRWPSIVTFETSSDILLLDSREVHKDRHSLKNALPLLGLANVFSKPGTDVETLISQCCKDGIRDNTAFVCVLKIPIVAETASSEYQNARHRVDTITSIFV